MPWLPGDPWPSGLEGGAASPWWGGYVRLWVRAGLAPGNPFHIGQHANDRLDAANVLGGDTALRAGVGVLTDETTRLWVDLSCDVLDVVLTSGVASNQGILSKTDAATCEVTLFDPDGIDDPVSPVPPWTFGGVSRLVPGTPVEVFAEVVTDPTATPPTVERHFLFTGTADSWGEDWTPNPTARRAKLVATDATKVLARANHPEQASVGSGDTTEQRVERILAEFDYTGPVDPDVSTVTLQATTLAQSAWELLNRTLDDELGLIYFTPEGTLRWVSRAQWFAVIAPVLELGCAPAEPDLLDIVTDAAPSNIDRQIRNQVFAARTGGTSQEATSAASVARFGAYDYKRTDLGLLTDGQALVWAQALVNVYAYPQVTLKSVTLRPDVAPDTGDAWDAVLALALITDPVRIVWTPPDADAPRADVTARVVGLEHRITRRRWELEWQLIASCVSAASGFVFTLGPHAQDRLDTNFVLG